LIWCDDGDDDDDDDDDDDGDDSEQVYMQIRKERTRHRCIKKDNCVVFVEIYNIHCYKDRSCGGLKET